MSISKFGKFEGKDVIILYKYEGDRFPFAFGIIKARMVLEHIDAIRDFVAKIDFGKSSDVSDTSASIDDGYEGEPL